MPYLILLLGPLALSRNHNCSCTSAAAAGCLPSGQMRQPQWPAICSRPCDTSSATAAERGQKSPSVRPPPLHPQPLPGTLYLAKNASDRLL